jgi:hypothetical protein
MQNMWNVENEFHIKSTNFVRVCGAEYNPLSYSTFKMLQNAASQGHEIGLHTSCVEYANINDISPLNVLEAEIILLRKFFDIHGLSTHRDINYQFNSLPSIEERWIILAKCFGLDYHAYEKRILDNVVYVNEGLSPHLCWRDKRPENVIETGRSICLLTHSHWWWKDYPFEGSP